MSVLVHTMVLYRLVGEHFFFSFASIFVLEKGRDPPIERSHSVSMRLFRRGIIPVVWGFKISVVIGPLRVQILDAVVSHREQVFFNKSVKKMM